MRFGRFLAAGAVLSAVAHGIGSAHFASDPNEVQVGASRGGAVSVIGSLEDLVQGTSVPLEAVETPEELVEPVEAAEAVTPVETPQEITPAAMIEASPVVQTPVADAVPVEPLPTEVSAVTPDLAPVSEVAQVQGVTGTQPVLPSQELPVVEPQKPVEIVKTQNTSAAVESRETIVEAEPSKPVEIAAASVADVAAEVTPEPAPVSEVVPDVVETQDTELPVTEAGTVPAPMAKPPAPKREKQQVAQKVKRGNAEQNSAKGGERVTSKVAKSNVNGRADSTSNDGGRAAKSNYYGKVVGKVRRKLKSQRRTPPNVARVGFTILRSGGVQNVRIVVSSGDSRADAAVIRAVKRAAPMPKIPGNIREERLPVVIPISFQ
ncbi:TonB family protein [Roseibium sp. RKSG952]|uniref:TonB family protein n=1 Tax=Roseibium sp. RKSG952 TaxID=2529384 RepID=UPI0012BB4CBB|nr:TonB family protein [Roseibium sp. RKSG952]MTH99994.1 TonB family protein [Roseibium sp. RKSG952]